MNPLETLTQAAQERGFITAWAELDLPEEAKERNQTWIADGHQAGMGYLERNLEVRLNPKTRFGWVQSVLVLAVPHSYPKPEKPVGGLRIGEVARYAWVRDYHHLIQPHLLELERLASSLNIQAKGYVDTGPLSERAYGALGSMGWIGRNAMLMRMGEGTYLTLAMLLTNSPLPPATRYPPPAYPNRCGRCTRCLTGCPTNALLGDGTLDSRKCIAYWTIEHRGLIPTDVWPSFGEWLFGCDICQEVCPWNHKAKAFWQDFRPEAELAHPNLEDFFTLSSKAFERKYARTVFLRPGRTCMARNALIVLANAADPAHLPLIRQAARDPNPVVRATAAGALWRFGDLDGASGLRDDLEPLVSSEAHRLLARSS